MVPAGKNSLDLLRLVAASFVLYSHQYALLGLAEPSFFGWNSFGGAGVTIFFFLSGMLVWSSWARDSNIRRFFQRRCLRIFPALWVVVILTIFVVGPLLTKDSFAAFFLSGDTWRYLTTALLLPHYALPGVFESNPYPSVVNGSLWTLPVEFLCYITVAVVGSFWRNWQGVWVGVALFVTVLMATYAPVFTGIRFTSHFEMVAIFWGGVLYGYCTSSPWTHLRQRMATVVLIVVASLLFALMGPRGTERMAILLFAMLSVFLAQRTDVGARLTDWSGDLSYGIYIYAFPVQQMVVYIFGTGSRSFSELFLLSSVITLVLAYLSWHFVESRALRFKPRVKIPL